MTRFHASDEFSGADGIIDYTLTTDSAPLTALRDHWMQARGSHVMPAHADLRPAAMKPALPFLMILEAINGGEDFKLRLIGTAIVKAAGIDETGRLLSTALHQRLATRMRDVCRHVMRRQSGMRGFAPLVLRDDVDFLAHEGIWLPLGADRRHADMVACATVFATMDRLRLEQVIKPMEKA